RVGSAAGQPMMNWRGLLVITAFGCLAAGPAGANCTNPAGTEADIIYNQDYHTYQFCNGSTWIAYGGAAGNGGLVQLSTQTASASASLQFTNLPTTYNTFFLNCFSLILSTNTHLYYRVGEGAGPTWQSGAHYPQSNFFAGVSNTGFTAVTNSTDIIGAAGFN